MSFFNFFRSVLIIAHLAQSPHKIHLRKRGTRDNCGHVLVGCANAVIFRLCMRVLGQNLSDRRVQRRDAHLAIAHLRFFRRFIISQFRRKPCDHVANLFGNLWPRDIGKIIADYEAYTDEEVLLLKLRAREYPRLTFNVRDTSHDRVP
jgi:hypothetical protein